MKHVWVTDCESSRAALTRPVLAKIADKRLGIEFACLRQSLWRQPGQRVGDPRLTEALPKPEDATDIVRWIDTDVMICDPLTKVMEPVKLTQALDSNEWDLTQPIESLLKKRAKQVQRRKTKPPTTLNQGEEDPREDPEPGAP